LKLFFDGRFINPNRPDGISSFSIGLITELSKIQEITVLVNSHEQAGLLPQVKTLFVNSPTSPLEAVLALRLRKHNIDVLFSPMQTTSSSGRNFKLILTLHDLIYYRHRTPPASFSWPIRLGWRLFHLSFLPQRMILNGADVVVTVSETTKQEMQKVNITKRPIHVIHNSSSEPDSEHVGNGSGSKDLIYMGSFIGYKNVEALIQGMGKIPDHRLVLLSRIDPKRKASLEKLAEQVNAIIFFADGVSEEEYSGWLSNAKALVSASLDEGFGIPIVEAMRHGTPVIVTDMEIFREVAGPAGLFFNPNTPSSFAEAVIRVSDAEIWKDFSQKAKLQAQEFSWEDSAQKLLALCQRIGSPTL
jgi:glycosyltransferase involved in cell wall biosynthesis